MISPWTLRISACFVLLAALPAAHAQTDDEPRPVLSVVPRADIVRSHAACPVDVRLTWNQPRLLEGDLLLRLYAGQNHLATITLHDFALLENQVSRPLLLPAVTLPDLRSQCLLHGEFLTKDQTFDLGTQDIPVSLDRKRVLVVGIVHPSRLEHPPDEFRGEVNGELALMHSLRIEGDPNNELLARDLVSRVVDVDPPDLPDHALELVAFDLLLLSGDALAELEDRQLEVIAEWVEAGGRVVVVSATATTSAQQRFLRRMADDSETDPRLIFDAEGALRLLRNGENGWIRGFPGVGRTVIASEPFDISGDAWRRQVLQLLGIRAPQRERLVRGEGWHVDLPAAATEFGYIDEDYPVMAATSLESEAKLPQTLMPESIQGVPFAAVCAVLVLCLIAAVPGDYLVLGWLKRRRWTWLTFPAIAFGFTLYTVSLAQSHVGNADYSTSLTVIDVADDGRIVKTIRYELLFSATEKTIETTHVDSLMAPFVPGKSDQWSHTVFDGESAGPFEYHGRVPTSYVLGRRHRQWAPRVSCETTFARKRSLLGPFGDFDWAAASTLETAADRDRLVADVVQRDPNAVVILVDQGEPTVLTEDRPAETSWRIAVGASVRGFDGVFGVISDRAPSLAGNFEDLALIDRTDSGDRLLVITRDDGNGNSTILRRVIRDRS